MIQNVAALVQQDEEPIVVNRKHLLTSTLRAVNRDDFSFWKPIRIVFSGEDAEDEGGPKREFFKYVYISLPMTAFQK